MNDVTRIRTGVKAFIVYDKKILIIKEEILSVKDSMFTEDMNKSLENVLV